MFGYSDPPHNHHGPYIGMQSKSRQFEAGRMLSLRGCTLVSLLGYNAGPEQFIQLYDLPAAPTFPLPDGMTLVPTFFIRVPSGNNFALDTPIVFQRGIYVTNSKIAHQWEPDEPNVWFLSRTM